MLLYLIFDSLLSTCPKKMETAKWPRAADSPLYETLTRKVPPVYLADFPHPVIYLSPSKNMQYVFFLAYKAACLCCMLMNKYFNMKPLACDHISTVNPERELPLIGG